MRLNWVRRNHLTGTELDIGIKNANMSSHSSVKKGQALMCDGNGADAREETCRIKLVLRAFPPVPSSEAWWASKACEDVRSDH